MVAEITVVVQFNVDAKKVSEVKKTAKNWNIKPLVQPGKNR